MRSEVREALIAEEIKYSGKKEEKQLSKSLGMLETVLEGHKEARIEVPIKKDIDYTIDLGAEGLRVHRNGYEIKKIKNVPIQERRPLAKNIMNNRFIFINKEAEQMQKRQKEERKEIIVSRKENEIAVKTELKEDQKEFQFEKERDDVLDAAAKEDTVFHEKERSENAESKNKETTFVVAGASAEEISSIEAKEVTDGRGNIVKGKGEVLYSKTDALAEGFSDFEGSISLQSRVLQPVSVTLSNGLEFRGNEDGTIDHFFGGAEISEDKVIDILRSDPRFVQEMDSAVSGLFAQDIELSVPEFDLTLETGERLLERV